MILIHLILQRKMHFAIPFVMKSMGRLNELFIAQVCNNETLFFSVGWDVEEEAKGHMVCCTYEELKAKIPFVPDLGDDVDLDTDITEP